VAASWCILEKPADGSTLRDGGTPCGVSPDLAEHSGKSPDLAGPRHPTQQRKEADGHVGPEFAPLREELHRFAVDLAREFNDQAPLRSTVSRLVNLFQRAGIPPEEFTEHLYAARQLTKERTGAIRKQSGEKATSGYARKNKMPYFLAIVEQRLGFREAPLAHGHPADEADAPVHDTPLPRPAIPRDLNAPRHPTGERSDVAPNSPPSVKVWGETRAEDPPVDEDARVIKGLVRTFSRQFTDYMAADALGDWAVTLWRRSGLSRPQFLEVAQHASVAMLRGPNVTPSAPLFQAQLSAELERPRGRETGDQAPWAAEQSTIARNGTENAGYPPVSKSVTRLS
jgi:hypothetical protein